MGAPDPFTDTGRRAAMDGPFDPAELRLANRNSGILLEALHHEVTPVGLHYLLNHFDVPHVPGQDWRVDVSGRVKAPLSLTLDALKGLPQRTLRVTLECAGNGRAAMSPRYPSMPWVHEAVGTADWTGTPLRHVLERAGGLADDAVEVACIGADRGFDRGHEHNYGRSLKREMALSDDVLVVWAMNGQPLLPQHGHPVRLIVPGWYGMASVKWLTHIEALNQPYQGFQQVRTYMYRAVPDGPTTPITQIRVKSLMVPPGLPDFYTRARLVQAGPTPLFGRAWSGAGVAIARVEIGIDGTWHAAQLGAPADASLGPFAWRGWHFEWRATPGEHELACRATDADGESQPLEARWDAAGFGNNAVQRVRAWVR